MPGLFINQFMWAFQPHFRLSAGQAVRSVLTEIGVDTESTVLLIGFANSRDAPHDICIEPETGPLTQEHLADAVARGDELYNADPESKMFHSDRDLHDRIQGTLARKWRGRAVAEVIEGSGLFGDVRAFVSNSTPIGLYEVHTCVLIDAETVDSVPGFDDDTVDRIYVGRSLLHEAIATCLGRADDALYRPDPGRGLVVLGETRPIVTAAADLFARGCVYRTDSNIGGLLDAVCAITSLSYERAEAKGSIVFIRSNHPDLEPVVRFRTSVSVYEPRAARKLLETTDDQVSLLCDEGGFFGLGTVAEETTDAITVAVPAHATWVLSHAGTDLMKVAYGRVTLPRPLLDRRLFTDTLERVVGPADSDTLWRLVDAASSSGHGSTLVVSADAAGEADRLAGQATPIGPTALTPEQLINVGRIDGALILDADGLCHAIGVILDGAAQGVGDPARGSRFNSSVRYQMAAPAPAVVIVVSADGTVDLVPRLHPRVSRTTVATAVADFVAAATAEQADGELFSRTHDQVLRLAFYLNADQCGRVNAAYEAEMERRTRENGMRLNRQPMTPARDMDDSYFLD